jgi:DNA-binding NtrC family response regulator
VREQALSGYLSPDVQPMLLRFLETGKYVAQLATDERDADILLVAATSQELENAPNFRKELYYRVARARVNVPTVRERSSDIPWLLRHFMEKNGKTLDLMPVQLLEQLMEYPWPGNIRELSNGVETACALLLEGRYLSLEDFPEVKRWIEKPAGDAAPAGTVVSAQDEMTDVLRRVQVGELGWKQIQHDYEPQKRAAVMQAVRDHFCNQKGWTLKKLAEKLQTNPSSLSTYYAKQRQRVKSPPSDD